MAKRLDPSLCDMLLAPWEKVWSFVSLDTYRLDNKVDPSSQSHGSSARRRESPIQNEWSGWEDTCLDINSCKET